MCARLPQPGTFSRYRSSQAYRTDPVVIDLSRLEYIDSHGLHAIFELRQRSLGRKIAVAVARPPATVRRLLEVVEMDHWLRVFPDVQTAVKNLSTA